MWAGSKDFWGRGPGVTDPCPLPHLAPSPNPLLYFFQAGEVGAASPAFSGSISGLGGGCGGRAGASGPWSSPHNNPWPRLLLTGPPQCGKTTVVRRVAARFPGKVAGFYTREVRERGVRVGFEIVTLAGEVAWLSHVDFPGPLQVGKYGVDLTGLHRLGLPALTPAPGVDLVVVDEVGKMECLSPLFVAAMERLWTAQVALLVTVAAKGGGYMAAIKNKPDARLITVTPANRDGLPERIIEMLIC